VLSRLFGSRRPDEGAVTARLREVVDAVPGADGQGVTYNHQPYAAGAVNGTVEVADSRTFVAVLRAVTASLVDQLGGDAERVTFYLAGRTPDGEPVVPGDLGFSQPPIGRELVRRFAG